MCFLFGSPCPSCVQRGKAQSCSCDISAFPGKNKANPALLSAAARQNASCFFVRCVRSTSPEAEFTVYDL